jgi:hypothetical protein
MIRDSSFHGWSDAQALVNAAQIVKSKMQGNGMLQIFQLLGEAQGQPSRSPNKRPSWLQSER